MLFIPRGRTGARNSGWVQVSAACYLGMSTLPRFPWLVLIAVVSTFTRSTWAAEAQAVPVVLAVDGINAVRNLPVLLTERLGYFRAEGLAVTLRETAAGPEIDAQLVDGRITGMVAYYHHTIVAQVEEKRPMIAVITLAVTPGYQVLVRAGAAHEITTPADLKGRRIISGGPHSAKTTSANWVVLHAGLQLSDYTRLSTAGKKDITAQLKNGEADAVVAPEPDASSYVAQGVAVPFLDLYSVAGTKTAIGSVFPTSVLYVSTSYARSHPELTQKLVNAFARTLDYIRNHSVSGIAKQVPEMTTGVNAAAAVLNEGVKMFATDGRMPVDAARAEAKVIAAQFPAYRDAVIEETFDNQFIDRRNRDTTGTSRGTPQK